MSPAAWCEIEPRCALPGRFAHPAGSGPLLRPVRLPIAQGGFIYQRMRPDAAGGGGERLGSYRCRAMTSEATVSPGSARLSPAPGPGRTCTARPSGQAALCVTEIGPALQLRNAML